MGVALFCEFVFAKILPKSMKRYFRCFFVLMAISKLPRQNFEEASGYKKCCTRFVLEPRIGRSSSARTSAAAAAEGEQHRVQQQRAAARFG